MPNNKELDKISILQLFSKVTLKSLTWFLGTLIAFISIAFWGGYEWGNRQAVKAGQTASPQVNSNNIQPTITNKIDSSSNVTNSINQGDSNKIIINKK